MLVDVRRHLYDLMPSEMNGMPSGCRDDKGLPGAGIVMKRRKEEAA